MTGVKLTAAQARRLADANAALSAELGRVARRHRDELSEEQKLSIRYARQDLLTSSNRLRNLSVRLSLDEVRTAVDRIEQVTLQIQDTIRRIENVKRAIELAAIGVQIASAAAQGNPGGVIDALGRAREALNGGGLEPV